MAINEAIKLSIGLTIVIAGASLFKYIYHQTKQGYRSQFGNDVKLYYAAGGAMVLGLFLIYKSLFS